MLYSSKGALWRDCFGKRRILPLLLCTAMLLSMVPGVLAAEAPEVQDVGYYHGRLGYNCMDIQIKVIDKSTTRTGQCVFSPPD